MTESKTTKSRKIELPKYAWRVAMSGAASMYETTFKTFPAALRWVGKNKTARDISIQIERVDQWSINQ
jgi:hypothetical protein